MVCLNDEAPPCTPSFIHDVPYFSLSRDIDVAWPPTTDMRSSMVTLNFSGCWARVAAHDYTMSVSHVACLEGLWRYHASSSAADDDHILLAILATLSGFQRPI